MPVKKVCSYHNRLVRLHLCRWSVKKSNITVGKLRIQSCSSSHKEEEQQNQLYLLTAKHLQNNFLTGILLF